MAAPRATPRPGALGPALRGLRRFGPFLLLALAVAWAIQSGLARRLTLEELAAHRATLAAFVTAHPLQSLAIFLALDVGVTALSLPGSGVLSLAAGLLFGPWLGGAAALAACTIGSTMFFLVCRGAAGGALAKRLGPRVAALESSIRRNAFSVLLSLRLAPVIPLPLTNLAAALFGARLKVFLAATLIGMAPASLVFAGLGSALGSLVDRGAVLGADFFFQPRVIWPLAGLMALSLGPLALALIRRARRRGPS